MNTIKIGTRGSPLALAQATLTQKLLIDSGMVAADAIEIVVIKTSGDRIQDRSLAEIGGKGLFTKEIEEALADGRIDLAVHSLKDLPAWMPDGLTLAAVLPREDPRDALLSPIADSIAALPRGARVGTSSPRRRALLLHKRPDLEIVEFRGNVGTRLAKLAAGEVAGTLLAVAGLKRLGLDVAHHPIESSEMLPAACQGAIGLETRLADRQTRSLCEAIGDTETLIAVTAERAFLSALDGSCRTPIAALATVADGQVAMEGLVARQDGGVVVQMHGHRDATQAAALGDMIGQQIKSNMPADFLSRHTESLRSVRPTLVLDLDGTLIDSAPDLVSALNRLMAARGLALFTRDDIVPMIGDGAHSLLIRAFAARDATFNSRELDVFVADYTANSAVETQVFPGVFDTLRAMTAVGWRIAVCTNKPSEAARSVLAAFDVAPFLAAIGGGDSFPTRKPDAAHLLGTLQAAGGRADMAVMVGDHANHLRAATAAGVPCIFAGWGYGTVAMSDGAAAVAECFTDLPVIAESLVGAQRNYGLSG